MPKVTINDAVWPADRRPTWDRTEDGYESPRYGSVRMAVVTGDDGLARYDRPVYYEAPHVIIVPWGYDGGHTMIGLVKEARPMAGVFGTQGSDPIFWGVPRGFVERGEQYADAAEREAGEESGVGVVLGLDRIGQINPNPTCFASWGPVFSLQTDLGKLHAVAPSRNEKIFKAEFFTVQKVLELIKGESHDGAEFTDGVSLAALMIFLSSHPEFSKSL